MAGQAPGLFVYLKGHADMSVLSAAKAEEAAQLISGQNIQIWAHDDDPGGGHDANVAPGLNPIEITTSDWTAFAEDTATAARGGRQTTNDIELEFAESAGDDGQIAYVTFWEGSGDGDGDGDGSPGEGEYDTWIKTVQLTAPVPYSTGNRVYVPIGDLEVFGAGSE